MSQNNQDDELDHLEYCFSTPEFNQLISHFSIEQHKVYQDEQEEHMHQENTVHKNFIDRIEKQLENEMTKKFNDIDLEKLAIAWDKQINEDHPHQDIIMAISDFLIFKKLMLNYETEITETADKLEIKDFNSQMEQCNSIYSKNNWKLEKSDKKLKISIYTMKISDIPAKIARIEIIINKNLDQIWSFVGRKACDSFLALDHACKEIKIVSEKIENDTFKMEFNVKYKIPFLAIREIRYKLEVFQDRKNQMIHSYQKHNPKIPKIDQKQIDVSPYLYYIRTEKLDDNQTKRTIVFAWDMKVQHWVFNLMLAKSAFSFAKTQALNHDLVLL